MIVKLFADNQFIRGFAGDIVVISLLYFFIKSLYNFHPLKLAIFIFFLACTIEFFQYLTLINILGLEKNFLAQLILGAVFDPADLLAYGIGAVTVYMIDVKLNRL